MGSKDERKESMVAVGPCGRRMLACGRWIRRFWWLTLVIFVALIAGMVAIGEYVTSRPAFCASCHNMTTYYESWQRDVHAKEGVICVDCHYAPGEKFTFKAKLRGLTQLAQYAGGAVGQVRPRGHVSNQSCMTAACHPAGSFESKSLIFPKSESGQLAGHALKPFSHEKHLGVLSTNQELQCATCHEHRAGETHLAVFREACYLCHFNKKEFNTDRARCLLCHELPEKPIQHSGESPITHQIMFDRGVSCASCHRDVVHEGGPVYKERCRSCHDQPTLLASWQFVKTHQHATKEETEACPECQQALQSELHLHEAHVQTQHANCFDCHIEIQHSQIEDPINVNAQDCRACHLEAHETTVALLKGQSGMDPAAPVLEPFEKLDINTVCSACHTVKTQTRGHREVLRGGQAVCQKCHGPEYKLFSTVKPLLDRDENEALQLQAQAHKALTKAKDRLSDSVVQDLTTRLKKADQTLLYVQKARPIHNPKTASQLLGDVMDGYEDTTDAITDALEDVSDAKK